MSGKSHRGVKRNGSSRVRPPHMSNSAITPETFGLLIGTPVCAVLADGTIYCGTVSGIENGELLLQGFRGSHKVSPNPAQAKAQIAALGGLGSLFGGGLGAARSVSAAGPGAAGGGLGGMLGGLFGGGGGGLGGFGGMGNMFRIGLGVMQFVFPLLKGFGV